MADSKKPTNNAPVNPIKSASSSANQQVHSKIMHLPQEVRDEIYTDVFRSTQFTYNFADQFEPEEEHRVECSARKTGLALLRTCRRMRDEIGVSWLHQVLFNFSDPRPLLDKLSAIRLAVREQIRHVSVSGRHLTIVCDANDDAPYGTANALKLLPGLQLDTLTVVGTGARRPLAAFYNLDKLIRHSDGWRELHYLSDNLEPLAYKVDGTYDSPWDPRPEYSPRPQPSDWQKTVEQRDGQASQPSVVIYQSAAVAAPGAAMPVLHSCIPKVFARAQATEHLRQIFTRDAKFFVRLEDATPMTLEALEDHRLLAVVKRGVGVDYAEKEGSPYLPFGDVRQYSPGMTWREIYDSYSYVGGTTRQT
jgi:hypothetical protein